MGKGDNHLFHGVSQRYDNGASHSHGDSHQRHRLLFAIFLFLALPCAHAQNYPLLTPGFSANEENFEAEREAAKNRINAIAMYWESSPAQIKAGEEIILTLRARNWVSQQPGFAFFMPPVPQGVILTPLSLSDEERKSGIAVKFKIIPLAAGEINLPARTLLYENLQFQIPALRLQVNSR